MPRKVLILDTTVLCCWLRVPGKETAGRIGDYWDFARIDETLTAERAMGSTFVLPIASLIETGNHIAQCSGNRYLLATSLSEHLNNAADAASPWAAFTDQTALWEATALRELARVWPDLAVSGTSIGDATIKHVAEFYTRAGYHVEILTGDEGLRAYSPIEPVNLPRRRN